MPFQFFSYEFRGLIVISSWFICYCWLVLEAFLVLYKKNKKVSLSMLRQLWVARATNSGDCNSASATSLFVSASFSSLDCAHIWWFSKVWPELVFFSFFLFLFFFLKSCVGHAKSHISLSIYFFSLDLVLLLLFAIFCIYIDYF
jgi:hypothetical protein